MGAGIKAMRAAKIWLILMVVAVIYAVRQKMGIPASQDISGDLNKFGETWLTFSYWIFGFALLLLILFKLGGRGEEDNEDGEKSESKDTATGDASAKIKQDGTAGGRQAASNR